MVRSRAVTIIVAILAAAGTLPQWSHGSTLEKMEADNSSHVDIQTVNAIVAAINQSILEFRATSVQLSARLEHVEKTVMDIAPDAPPRIFMATHQAVKAFSWSTNDAVTVKTTTNGQNNGMAYDPRRHQLYWCSSNVIYRGSKNDDQMEIVYNSVRSRDVISDGSINSLAFDWITDNLYGVSSNGIVFACNTTAGPMIECLALLSGQGSMHGIAVDPLGGKMYWAIDGYLKWADMDGANVANYYTSGSNPRNLVVDYAADGARLYWVDAGNHRIQSGELRGGNVRTITTLANTNVGPWGIAVLNDRIYVGTTSYGVLASVTKSGEDLRTLYDGPHQIRQMVLTTNHPPQNHTNNCGSLQCTRLCVLKPSSAICIT